MYVNKLLFNRFFLIDKTFVKFYYIIFQAFIFFLAYSEFLFFSNLKNVTIRPRKPERNDLHTTKIRSKHRTMYSILALDRILSNSNFSQSIIVFAHIYEALYFFLRADKAIKYKAAAFLPK